MSGSTRWPAGLLLLATILSVATAEADDEADERRADESIRSPLLEDGGYVELGLGLRVEQSEREAYDPDADIEVTATAAAFLAGAWRRGRAFAEGRWGSVDGASLGLTAWADRSRTIDVLLLHLAPTANIAYARDERAETAEERRDKALVQRDTGFGSSGLRWREYRGRTLFQFSTVADWTNGNGVLASAHLGRQWQLGNWSAEGVLGLRWASDELADFLYGVDADEASERFAAHEAGDGFLGDAELALSRPLGRDWVLRTQARLRVVDDGIMESPLVARRAGVGVDAAISYVF